MTAPSPRYRQLALATLLMTFLLIVIGGIVRVSDSGLGCGPADSGFHGWPFCEGDVAPGVDLNSIIEYTHRVVASIVGLMMLALAVLAWRNYREHRMLVKVSIAGFLLVAAQGALGGAVVEENLEEELVAAHLGLAMLLLAVLFWIWRATKPETIGADPPDAGPRYRPLAWVASVGRALHDRGGRLHGRHAELRPRRLPARRRRASRVRQGVPHLQRRVHAVRRGAARGHPPDAPLLHVPRRRARAGARRPDAAATAGRRAGEGRVGRARDPRRAGARRRAERLARRVRGADRPPPRPRDAAVVDCHRHDAARSTAFPRRSSPAARWPNPAAA